MNCEFCQHQLNFSHHENNKEVEVYDCTNCPVLTSFSFFAKDGMRMKTAFMIDRSEKLYVWTNNYINNTSSLNEVNIKRQSEPLIIKFPKIMNIDPNNVQEKMAIYLVFS